MLDMANDKKILIQISEKMVSEIDDYRFENRFNSRSEAIRHLLEIALENVKKEPGVNKKEE